VSSIEGLYGGVGVLKGNYVKYEALQQVGLLTRKEQQKIFTSGGRGISGKEKK